MRNFQSLAIFCGCTARFLSDLVGNPEDRFSHNEAHLYLQLLAATIQHEKPELEEKKTALLKQEEDLKIELAKLEESLLEVRNIPLKHIDIYCLYFLLEESLL